MERKTKNCGWYFKEEFLQEIAKAAERRGLPAVGLARMIIIEWLEKNERHRKE